MTAVIEVNDLRKVYGDTVAVDDISFAVKQGEIFGIVGPNGAGKTTTVECVTGLRRPDSGVISVLGIDPQRQERNLRRRLGIQIQEAELPINLKVWEALDLFASFYDETVTWDALINQWGLTEKRNTRFDDLSGGQKQRLFIALALLNDPEVVVLDELTTGLDPQARRHTWDLIKNIRDEGKTVVLVTHFMDEAEELCDRVAIIDHGSIVALDSPEALISRMPASQRVCFTATNGFTPDILMGLPVVTDVTQDGTAVTVHGSGQLLARVVTTLDEHDIEPANLRSDDASLEDVFIHLTGRQLRD